MHGNTYDSRNRILESWAKAISKSQEDINNELTENQSRCDCGGFKTYQSSNEVYHSSWCASLSTNLTNNQWYSEYKD